MLRLLIGLGAIYAAFKFGRDVGQVRQTLLNGPVDYERRPLAPDYKDFGLEPPGE